MKTADTKSRTDDANRGTPAEDAAALNARVAEVIKREVAAAQKSGRPIGPDVAAAMRPTNGIMAGAPIYLPRWGWVVYTYVALGATFIILGCKARGALCFPLCLAAMYIGYDFYSGVLHVVLDHPGNIAVPLLGQPCLEFQWHHFLPDDIVSKSYVQACADLNVVVGILAGIHFAYSSAFGKDAVALVLTGCKLIMAYFGQFSHRSSHKVHGRSAMVKFLQNNGFMISFKDHHVHHTPPHDDNFCLIGFCNPLLTFLTTKVTSNPNFWLSVFLLWSVFDVKVMTMALAPLASMLPMCPGDGPALDLSS